MYWIVFALFAAVCTSLTTILAKVGLKGVNSNFATMFRTGIVIICSFLVVLISGNFDKLTSLQFENYIYLFLSGIATGASWLCYYKALKLGDVNKVAPIDKSSFILSSILFLIFFFNETTNNGDIKTIIALIAAMILMFCGTLLMINKGEQKEVVTKSWLIYAILSAVFAALVSLFVKLGLQGIPSSVGTFYRTIIVFVFASLIVIFRKDYKDSSKNSLKSYIFLILSGLATGGAWLFEYEALNVVEANPVAVSVITKASILLTMLISFLFLKEKFNKKSIFGLGLLTISIALVIVFSL